MLFASSARNLHARCVSRSQFLVRCLAIAQLFLLTGCISIRLIDPNEPFELASDEGLLILHTVTDLPITSLELDGQPFLQGVPTGTRFQVFIAKEGTHRFSGYRIVQRAGRSDQRWITRQKLRDKPGWRFEVHAGKINYPGQLALYTYGSHRMQRTSIQLSNRTGLVYRHIRKKYPELLDQYSLQFTGSTRDEFLAEFLEAEESD